MTRILQAVGVPSKILEVIPGVVNTCRECRAWAKAGKPDYPPEQWLPPSLLVRAAAQAEKLDGWSLDSRPSRPKLMLKRPDGTQLIGTYKIRRRRITNVTVTTRRKPSRKRSPPRRSSRKRVERSR